MHCDNPACATLCPFAANHKFENGAVVIDQDACFGGAKCKTVCPWEIPQRQSGVGVYLKVLPTLMGNGVMYKCDLCSDLLKEGQNTRLHRGLSAEGDVDRSPEGDLREGRGAGKKDRRISLRQDGKRRNEHALRLSRPVRTPRRRHPEGTGRAGPGAVKRRMAGTDAMGKAVLAAPALGIAAGLAGAFAFISKRKDRIEEGGIDHVHMDTEEKNRVVRHGWIELAEHWAIALSGLLLLLSGMFELPMAARYKITAVPGFGWSGDFIISLYDPLCRVGGLHRRGVLPSGLPRSPARPGTAPPKGDLKASIDVVKTFFGKGEEPPFDKYLPEQRLAYLGMAVIIAVLSSPA